MADLAEELNSLVSDSSFVILGNGSLSHELNDERNSVENVNRFMLEESMKSQKQDSESVTPINSKHEGNDENSNEIHLKLDQLVRDNLLLKETLSQSNMAMKSQFSKLSLWYDEVVKTHESHKKNFLESQNQIAKLQLENLNLKKVVEDIKKNAGSLNSVEKCGKDKAYCDEAHRNNEILCLMNEELERRLEIIINENTLLEKKLNELLEKDGVEGEKIIRFQGGMKDADGIKNSNGKDSNKHDVTSLDSDISVIHKLPQTTENELESSEMKKEIAELKKQLSEQQNVSQLTNEMENMKTKYEDLLREQNGLLSELKSFKSIVDQNNDEIKSLRMQCQLKEELLESKTQELIQLQNDMQKLVLDCEEVAILRAQVELYQNDFNEERNAREKAVEEKEKMAEQVRLLERTLSDLKRKEGLQEKQQRPEAEREGSTSSDKSEEAKTPYLCPKCLKRFSIFSQCQSHVNYCLDTDQF